MLWFQALSSRRFQHEFHRNNLHRLTVFFMSAKSLFIPHDSQYVSCIGMRRIAGPGRSFSDKLLDQQYACRFVASGLTSVISSA
jgi:hypothetical protein